MDFAPFKFKSYSEYLSVCFTKTFFRFFKNSISTDNSVGHRFWTKETFLISRGFYDETLFSTSKSLPFCFLKKNIYFFIVAKMASDRMLVMIKSPSKCVRPDLSAVPSSNLVRKCIIRGLLHDGID